MAELNKVSEQKTKRRDSGSAAVELALFIPVLAIFLTGVTELGFGVYQATQVYNASEAGMIYASKYGWDSTGISAAVVNATGMPGITATPAPTQFCGCASTTSVTTVACASQCSNGTSPGAYIKVNAALTRQSIVSFPGLPLPTALTAMSIVRVN